MLNLLGRVYTNIVNQRSGTEIYLQQHLPRPRVGHASFSKERNVLAFFIKERGILCVLLLSMSIKLFYQREKKQLMR